MKTKISFSVILLAAVITVTSCNKKKDEPVAGTGSSSFSISLTADKTIITLGDQSKITASVSGASGSVNYAWSVNTGSTLTGSGTQVTLYASCPSCTGPNEVTCTATDANNVSVVKKITITVQ